MYGSADSAFVGAGIQMEDPFAVLAMERMCGVCKADVIDMMETRSGNSSLFGLNRCTCCQAYPSHILTPQLLSSTTTIHL